MAVCTICGQQITCTNPHTAPEHQLGGATLDCPLQKGAIYVYVKDDTGTGVKGVKVTCTGGPQDTDDLGFAFYDPLAEGPHATSISLTPTPLLEDKYYIFSTTPLNPVVSRGRITQVEFQINRLAPLKVAVTRSDKGTYLKSADIKVETTTANAAPSTPNKPSLDTGPVEFAKLRKTSYKVTVTLAGTDKDNFIFDDKAIVDYVVDPSKDNLLEFPVSPAGWIAFKFIDNAGADLKVVAKLSLEQVAMGAADKDTAAEGTLRVEKLEPGDMQCKTITLPEQYEFVSLASA